MLEKTAYNDFDVNKADTFQDYPFCKSTLSALKKENFENPTAIQKASIIPALLGKDVLGAAKTGSGKTLTAFLSIIDQLVRRALDGKLEKRVYCVYISPIKALANDIQRNLL